MDLENWKLKWRISRWTPNGPLPTRGYLFFGGWGVGKVNCLVVFPTHFNPNNPLLILLQISLLFMFTPTWRWAKDGLIHQDDYFNQPFFLDNELRAQVDSLSHFLVRSCRRHSAPHKRTLLHKPIVLIVFLVLLSFVFYCFTSAVSFTPSKGFVRN